MKDIRATILVNSCDSYEDAWYPFFELFKTFWKDCNYPIVLNTESKAYKDSDLDIKSYCLYSINDCVPYGKRLLEHLDRIDSEYIIMMMDDFFLRAQVDNKKLEYYLDYIAKNPEVAYISFDAVEDDLNIDDDCLQDCLLRPRVGQYKVNLQSGIWRKNKLIKYIKPHENPWEFEDIGSLRSFESFDKFYTLKNLSLSPIKYGKKEGLTWGIVRGKWVVDDIDPLFKYHGIEIDYNIRGIYDPNNFINIAVEKNNNSIRKLKSYGIWLFIKINTWRMINYIKRRLGFNFHTSWFEYKRKRCYSKNIQI